MGLFLFCGTGTLKAATVDEETARTVASNVLGVSPSQLENKTTWFSNSTWRTRMYLFIPSNRVGFAIISATDYAMPVLGYSTTAVFDSALSRSSYSGIYQWISNCNSQLGNLVGGSYAASATVAAQWAQLTSGAPVGTIDAIEPMLTTKWNQTGDYMLRTPMSGTSASAVHCPAGGAAVAMAQVMKYYSHPERGTGSYSYTNSGSWSTMVSANFDTIYDYANMPDQLTDGSTDLEKGAVSHLLFHTGTSVQMRYYSNYAYMYSSGGNPLATALKNYFNFRTTTEYIQYSSTYYTTWTTKLMDEIILGRPVIYTGGSHLNFVVDGCDNRGNFHINWGQGGMFDGYFVIGSLNPGSYNYSNSSQYAVIGIAPLSAESVTISTSTNNAAWGSVGGGGPYTKYQEVILTARPVRNEQFTTRFVRWSDGNTDNPRRHMAVADRTFTAEFEYFDNITVNAVPNNAEWGTVTGSGNYAPFDKVSQRATPIRTSQYTTRFVRWSDGSSGNPRVFDAGTVDRNDTAIFEYFDNVVITAEPNNTEWGTTSGSGNYAPFDRVTLTATPAQGATFVRWSDGNTSNPYTFTAGNSNRRCIAVFSYVGDVTITATPNNAAWGSVSGGGTYMIGSQVSLAATAAPGYRFSQWSDGSTQNPKRYTATVDRTESAIFVASGSAVAPGTPDNPVVLDDRENHSWSYYSDPTNPVRSLNPADVKITYFGYGPNTMYSSHAATPTGNPDVNVAANHVGIGIDAPSKNSYVYHKTLERHGGTTARSMASSTGPCKYHVIANPFSIRPTYGSGDTRWRGFYKWRVRRLVGGAIFTDRARTQMVAQGGMVDADQDLWLDPAAEYGMEIEFEAIWARAFIFEPTGPMEGINDTLVTDDMRATGTNAYERNFVVLTPSNIESITDTTDGTETTMAYNMEPLTITAIYPDGTDGSNNTRLTAVPAVALNQHFFCMADTKFEYIFIDAPTKAFAGNGFNIAMGRGISHTSGPSAQCLRKLVGLSALWPKRLYSMHYTIDTIRTPIKDSTISLITHDTIVSATNDSTFIHDTTWTFTHDTIISYDTTDSRRVYRIDLVEATNEYDNRDGHFVFRIESGNYKDVMPLYGGIYPYYLNSDWTSNANTASPGTGNQPTIYDNFGVTTFYSNYAIFGSDYDRSIEDNYKLTATNYLQGAYGGWLNRSNSSVGLDQYNWLVKSGNFLPGRLGYGQGGTTTFYISSVGTNYWSYASRRRIDVEGGLVPGISGGQDWSTEDYVDPADTNIWIRVRGGHIRGIIHGAGEYASAKGGRRIVITGGTINGWVAGGCNGSRTDGGELIGDAYVYIGGTARIEPSAADPFINSSRGGNVFGAGSGNSLAAGEVATVGKVNNSTVVIADSCYIARNVYGGGNYGGVIGIGSHIYLLGGTVAGKVFGGANQQMGKQVDLVMRGGQVLGGVYGGSNIMGKVSGPISVRIEGGTVGYEDCPEDEGNVFGCGYGEQSDVSGDVEVIIGNEATKFPHVDNPVIYNNVYGGAFYAPYSSKGRNFSVTTWNGEIKGSVFGGGLGTTAVITGDTRVNIFGTSTVRENVYGGGNMGKISGDTRVIIGDDARTYTITVTANNAAMGTVAGGGDYLTNHEVSISATPTSGYRFKRWNDGNTDNPRIIIVNGEASYTAEFEIISNYTITVESDDTDKGTVSGGGSYMADHVVSISATANDGYRFIRWDDGSTENPRSILVTDNATYTAIFDIMPEGWVDLGLPSGLLWAKCNVGATQPHEYGNYYAWGEIEPKSTYDWTTYIHGNGSSSTMVKYTAADGRTILEPEDDVATVVIGDGARIPAMEEWVELFNHCTVTTTSENGVNGRRITGPNGNSIFVPYTGYKYNSYTSNIGYSTYFWSSMLSTTTQINGVDIYIHDTYAGLYGSSTGGEYRYYGFPIRAVRSN